MGKPVATYSTFIRSAWFALAVFLVVFCGPVKKLIKQRFDNNAGVASSSQSINHKLRTGYREKREIAQLVQFVSHPAPHAGLPLFLAAAFIFIVALLSKGVYFKAQPQLARFVPDMPLYLRIRKLQV